MVVKGLVARPPGGRAGPWSGHAGSEARLRPAPVQETSAPSANRPVRPATSRRGA